MLPRLTIPSVAVVLTAVTAVPGVTQEGRTTSRSCDRLLNQEVCTWFVEDGSGVVTVGATVPLSLIEAVPLDAQMTWPPRQLGAIALPREAAERVGIDHLGVNWEAHGHPPSAFATPHFDFHFYSMTQAQVAAVDCADETKPPTLPAGYALPDIDVPELGTLVGLCVPKMGMHAMPAEDVEATEPFTATVMIGYYGGRPIFVEPMVSRDRLLQRSTFRLPIPEPPDLPAGIHYPTGFEARYDPANDAYDLILTGFVRAGS